MRVLIKLTAPAKRIICGKVSKYLKAFCVVIQKKLGVTNGKPSLSDNTYDEVMTTFRSFWQRESRGSQRL